MDAFSTACFLLGQRVVILLRLNLNRSSTEGIHGCAAATQTQSQGAEF